MLKVMAERIKELAKESGVPVSKMLADCGITKSFMYDITERGVSPSADKVTIIADYFNVSVDYLLGKTDIRNTAEHDEVDEYLDILHKRGDMRMLFSVAKNATKEDIEIAADIIEKLIKKERGEL